MKHFLLSLFSLSLLLFTAEANACSGDHIEINISGNGNCEGGQVTLIVFVDSPNGPNGTFTWRRENGFLPLVFPKTPVTDPFVVISNFASKYNGTYTVTYTDTNGCTSEASVFIQVLKNPVPFIRIEEHCYGLQLHAFDSLHTRGPFTYAWLEDGSTESSVVYNGTGGPGSNRTVSVTNGLGCSAQTNTGILSASMLDVKIRGKVEFPEGGSTTLTATANYPVKFYTWYRNNVKVLRSATANQLVITDTAQYWLRVLTTEGCINNSYRRTSYTGSSVRIQDTEKTSSFELSAYPNPAKDEIQLGGLIPGEIRIYDLTGRICKIFTTEETGMTLTISDWIPGIYLLKSGDQAIRIVKR